MWSRRGQALGAGARPLNQPSRLFSVNLPYWGGFSQDTLGGASGVRRLHPLCSVLESNHSSINKGRYCCAAIFTFWKIKHSFLSFLWPLNSSFIFFSDQTKQVELERLATKASDHIQRGMGWDDFIVVASPWATPVALSHLKSFLDNLWGFFFVNLFPFLYFLIWSQVSFWKPFRRRLGVLLLGWGWRLRACGAVLCDSICSENETKKRSDRVGECVFRCDRGL